MQCTVLNWVVAFAAIMLVAPRANSQSCPSINCWYECGIGELVGYSCNITTDRCLAIQAIVEGLELCCEEDCESEPIESSITLTDPCDKIGQAISAARRTFRMYNEWAAQYGCEITPCDAWECMGDAIANQFDLSNTEKWCVKEWFCNWMIPGPACGCPSPWILPTPPGYPEGPTQYPDDGVLPWGPDERDDFKGGGLRPDQDGNIDTGRGALQLKEIDLSLPAPGFPWVIGRGLGMNAADGSGDYVDATETYQGWNWVQLSNPTLVFFAPETLPSPDSRDMYYRARISHGTTSSIDFALLHAGGFSAPVSGFNEFTVYEAGGGSSGALLIPIPASGDIGTADSVVEWATYLDTSGTSTYFFNPEDPDATTMTADAAGRLWKIVDAGGNTAWIGHPTDPEDARDNGYDPDGHLLMVVDPAGRRFSYSYSASAIGGTKKLESVVVEVKTGGEWYDSSETGVREVARVEYSYYTATTSVSGDTLGVAGDLEGVSVTMPTSLLDGSSDPIAQTVDKHYRYYDSASFPHMLKMVVGAEGVRRNASITTLADSVLKPFAEQFVVYKGQVTGGGVDQSDPRIHSSFLNGECGCGSGAIDGVSKYAYEANGSYVAPPTGALDQNNWFTRTIITRPDNTYETRYLNDRYQLMATVITEDDPSLGASDTWITRLYRDTSTGQILETHTPSANTGYSHATGLGSITSTTTGLVWVNEYEKVPVEGMLLVSTRWKDDPASSFDVSSDFEYDLTDTNLVESREYETRLQDPFGSSTIGSLKVVGLPKTVISGSWSYHAEGEDVISTDASPATGSYKTEYIYTWWESTDEELTEYILPKSIETQLPAISTAKNGSNTSNSSNAYFKKDGRLVFSEDEIGVLSYTAYDDVTGMPRYTIDDVDTSWTSGSFTDLLTALNADETEYGVTSNGTLEFHNITEYRYDDQGRTIEADLNAGSNEERTVKTVYGKLHDDRLYVIAIPKVDGTDYYGPASFTVMNLAGSVEEQGTLDLGAATITTDPTTSHWLDPDETTKIADNTDLLLAIDVGSASSLSTTQYDDLGFRAESSRLYHNIPASGTGSIGNNYDETTYEYDDMSRVTKVTDPTGTISVSVYDTLGRVEASRIGTSGGNMTTVRQVEYDGGTDGGNSYVTEQTLIVDESSSSDDRVTTYYHDVRGRVVATIAAEAPHSYTKYDNIGNVTESSTHGTSYTLTTTVEPPTLEDDRLSLIEMSYDELARPYRSRRFILTSVGNKDFDATHLISKTWYDQRGQVAKTFGSTISKTLYDRLGRGVFQAVLIGDNDTDYDDAITIVSDQDVIASQSETIYDPLDGMAILSVSMERHHDLADTVYGVLGKRVTIAASTAIAVDPTDEYDDDGRLSVSATFYDLLDRPLHSVAYGLPDATVTRKNSSWDHSGVPTREDDGPLVMSTTYGSDGRVSETADTLNRKTAMMYDDASRVVLTIENKTPSPTLTTEDRDTDRYVRTKYENGLRTHLWIDMQGNDTDGEPPTVFTPMSPDENDQVTVYDYGVTKDTTLGTSRIQSNRLLSEVIYPDSASGSDTVTYAYNAQGQEIFREDQTQSKIVTTYDKLGRPTEKDADLGGSSGFDASVDKIQWTYNERGLTESVKQLNSSSTVLDEVRTTYTTLNELEFLHQDFDSAWTSMGNHKTVEFEYGNAQADGAFVSSFRHRRRVGHSVEDTSSLDVTYSYGSSSSRDNLLGRVAAVSYEGLTVAGYEYNGMASVVGTELPEVDLSCYRYDPGGSDPSVLGRLDRFSRIRNDYWTRTVSGTSTERAFYDVTVEFNRGASVENVRDGIHTSWTYDYTNDGFDRLTAAPKGTWTGGDELATSGAGSLSTTVSNETFALSQTGNWLTHQINLDNTGPLETDTTGTFNRANEATGYSGTPAATPVYDPVGNLTENDEGYEYVYDVWGRLRSVYSTENAAVVAQFEYNGMGYKIGERHDEDASGDLTNDDPWERHLYDDRWRIVATYTAEYDTSSYITEDDPTEFFVYHAAGMNGSGSYIDAVILRDRDATAPRDGALEQRVYFVHNWRGDVVALWEPNALGSVHVLDIRYDPYGLPTTLPFGDFDEDGSVEYDDFVELNDEVTANTDGPEYDLNYDGEVDGDDLLLLVGLVGEGGRGVLGYTNAAGTSPAVIDRGYSGAIHDRWLADTNGDMTFVHMRYRYYDASRGRWTRRDPLEYSSGSDLYQYASSMPCKGRDPLGLEYDDITIPVWEPQQIVPGLWMPFPVIVVKVSPTCSSDIMSGLSHPHIQYLLRAIARCRASKGTRGLSQVNIQCHLGCRPNEPPMWIDEDNIIGICVDSQGRYTYARSISPSGMLAHELTHLLQICTNNLRVNEWSCKQRLFFEIQAYMTQYHTKNDPNAPVTPIRHKHHGELCRQACASVTSMAHCFTQPPRWLQLTQPHMDNSKSCEEVCHEMISSVSPIFPVSPGIMPPTNYPPPREPPCVECQGGISVSGSK